MTLYKKLFLFLFFCFIASFPLKAQDRAAYEKDLSYVLEIPQMKAITASGLHLYALSEDEGLIVFRAYQDSLQWLYTASGVQQRGSYLQSDTRFAYLLREDGLLSVLEPTSLLGVFSSTMLPDVATAVARLNETLYISLGDNGLAKVYLNSPAAVDSSYTSLGELTNEQGVRDILVVNDKLIVLCTNGLFLIIEQNEDSKSEELVFYTRLKANLLRLYNIDEQLFLTDRDGLIYSFQDNKLNEWGHIPSVVKSLYSTSNDTSLLAQDIKGNIWLARANGTSQMVKESLSGSNSVLLQNKHQFWLAENNQLFKYLPYKAKVDTSFSDSTQTVVKDLASPTFKKMFRVTHTFPQPLILPLELESGKDREDVSYSFKTELEAKLRGSSLLWKPTPYDIGSHTVTFYVSTADRITDSMTVNIELRSFNTPPRFSPMRELNIAVGEEFSYKVVAIDPDGKDKTLNRYIGVKLPEGATLNEKTGEFKWTPQARHIGKNTFKVIATDQYGASSQTELSLMVQKIQK